MIVIRFAVRDVTHDGLGDRVWDRYRVWKTPYLKKRRS